MKGRYRWTRNFVALSNEQGCVCCVRDFKDQSKPSKLCALQGLSSQPFIFLPFYHGPMGLKGIAKVAIAVYKVGFEERMVLVVMDKYRELAETAPEVIYLYFMSGPCGEITLTAVWMAVKCFKGLGPRIGPGECAISNFNHGSTCCKISMLHVPPENNEFEGEIIPCSDFRLGTSQPCG
ncbi:hypothetical protein Tco_0097878 [Tanacetum coccineum]